MRRTTSVWVGLLVFSTLAGLGAGVFGQGSLTPPGAPAETMKTLDQLYDVAKLGETRTPITSIPFVISEPGSYYLTTNLSSANGGIYIQANRVSLDFRGFAITGNRSTSFHGVMVGETWTNIQAIAIKGGTIAGFGTGLYVRNVDSLLVQNMIIVSNAMRGVDIYPYQGNAGGIKVSGCLISGNSGIGVYFEPTLGECGGNTIEDCTIRGNDGFGVYLYGGNGACVGNVLQRNNIGDNVDYGVNAFADANLIQDNHIWKQRGASSYGIYAWGNGSFVIRNTCIGNTNNYSLGPNVTYGPIVTNTGALPSAGDASHPLANFSR